MKSRLTSRFPRSIAKFDQGSRKGFTLVEILTAVTVMAIMISFMGAMLLTMSEAWQNAQKRVNNFTKARGMLDIMDHDIQAGLFRADLPAFPNGSVQFYTLRPGVSTSNSSPQPPVRSLSAVNYQLNTATNILQRYNQYYDWSTANALNFGATAAFPAGTAQDTAPGVIDFKVMFIQNDGTLSTTYSTSTTNPTRAVGFTLAVVDDQTMTLLSTGSMGQVNSLRSGLETAFGQQPARSVKATWEDYLNGMNWASYPKGLGVGFKIFERYVILPNAT